ncbi:UPF0175 family protein [Anaerovibrio sp. RM50]|uniref:UPF0175 family protein n=1 Tax=Anaerovibrio sp. RM50 TaxID=1200557 RepID=UPI000684B284|nr:UPF0175 family protein [Anaerovibrio sp. RM50]
MLNIPNDVMNFMEKHPLNKEGAQLQAALLLYPYIQNEEISHGYAAKLLGIDRLSLISLYESVGIPYLHVSAEEIKEEINVYNNLRNISEKLEINGRD